MKSGVIVEDHPAAQRWLTEALQAAFPAISIRLAASVEDALALLTDGLPEIALVDLNLPDGSGIEVISRLNTLAPKTITVVATIYDDDDHIFPALRAGAKGYILKEQRKEEISRMLQGIAQGEPPLSPAISQRLISYFSHHGQEQVSQTRLTERERQVLRLIAQGQNLLAVAEKLGVTRNTVATQVKSIYRKLDISSRAEAALIAAKLGLSC